MLSCELCYLHICFRGPYNGEKFFQARIFIESYQPSLLKSRRLSSSHGDLPSVSVPKVFQILYSSNMKYFQSEWQMIYTGNPKYFFELQVYFQFCKSNESIESNRAVINFKLKDKDCIKHTNNLIGSEKDGKSRLDDVISKLAQINQSSNSSIQNQNPISSGKVVSDEDSSSTNQTINFQSSIHEYCSSKHPIVNIDRAPAVSDNIIQNSLNDVAKETKINQIGSSECLKNENFFSVHRVVRSANDLIRSPQALCSSGNLRNFGKVIQRCASPNEKIEEFRSEFKVILIFK